MNIHQIIEIILNMSGEKIFGAALISGFITFMTNYGAIKKYKTSCETVEKFNHSIRNMANSVICNDNIKNDKKWNSFNRLASIYFKKIVFIPNIVSEIIILFAAYCLLFYSLEAKNSKEFTKLFEKTVITTSEMFLCFLIAFILFTIVFTIFSNIIYLSQEKRKSAR